MKKITTELFHQTVYFFDISNEEDNKLFLEWIGKHIPCCYEQATLRKQNLGTTWNSGHGHFAVSLHGPIQLTTPLLVHECIHAASRIMEYVNISLCHETEEVLAYLTENILKGLQNEK